MKEQTEILVLDPSAIKMAKAEKRTVAVVADSHLDKVDSKEVGVLSQILKAINSQETDKVQRMAFEVDPKGQKSGFMSLYYDKVGLTPDNVIKRIVGPNGNELVCHILQARANHLSSFGRRRTSRFALGYEFQETKRNSIPEELRGELQTLVDTAVDFLWSCGGEGLDEISHPNLSQSIKMLVRDGVAYGRFAVEIVKKMDVENMEMKAHAFRVADVSTIKRIVPEKELDQSTRKKSLSLLQRLKKEKFDYQRYKQDEYAWVQVIDGQIVQAFSKEELIVYNLYPSTSVEHNHYPLSPIDQALNAITTNINITIYNKLYFQNGRAAKGAWVIQSDSLDETHVQKIRNQHIQSINSATNAHRTPVFLLSSEDKMTWTTIDSQGKDAEFQYLTDQNCRIILSAFQMSPEELPGYSHLARGTNSSSLSESSNEYKLVAARDVGLRPLIYDIQDFFNAHIVKIFFPKVARYFQFVLSGLDHDDPEKEATRLQQDAQIHMTYDDILEKVEKRPIGDELGGKFPLNPQIQAVVEKYLTFGEILENFFGRKGASADPRFQFYQNPMWVQQQQFILQKAQLAMQAQMQAQQAQMQAQMAAQGQDPNAQQGDQQGQEQDPTQKSEITYHDLNKAIKTNHDTLTNMILGHHAHVTEKRMKEWKDSSKQHLEKIKAKMKKKVDSKK